MSLSVYLTIHGVSNPTRRAIYVRTNGATREISRAEWDELHPFIEPVLAKSSDEDTEVFWDNITHNLTSMADAAGLYDCCWRPDEHGWTHARDIIQLLRNGLEKLRANPDHYAQFNPPNGWGSYEGLRDFVSSYLAACELWPDAKIWVSR